MAKRQLLAIVGMCLLLSGCGVYKNAARTLFHEMRSYPRQVDRDNTREAYGALAELAWQEVAASEPNLACSGEYRRGFKSGYVDYLYAGGTGEAPAVPPRCFWNLDYRTPAGHQAVENWFTGFRRGALVARLEGRRQLATVPSSLRLQRPAPKETPFLLEDGMEILTGSDISSGQDDSAIGDLLPAPSSTVHGGEVSEANVNNIEVPTPRPHRSEPNNSEPPIVEPPISEPQSTKSRSTPETEEAACLRALGVLSGIRQVAYEVTPDLQPATTTNRDQAGPRESSADPAPQQPGFASVECGRELEPPEEPTMLPRLDRESDLTEAPIRLLMRRRSGRATTEPESQKLPIVPGTSDLDTSSTPSTL